MKQIPIQSFLQSRKELVKWLHTIHNLTNTMLGKHNLQPFFQHDNHICLQKDFDYIYNQF